MIKVSKDWLSDGGVRLTVRDTDVKEAVHKWDGTITNRTTVRSKVMHTQCFPRGTLKADIEMAKKNLKLMFITKKELI